MLIKCSKCRKFVDQISIEKKRDVTYIHATCHGETDTMTLTDEWQRDNQDFIFVIMNDMTVGEAFKENREKEEV